jgi:hypothetical protein
MASDVKLRNAGDNVPFIEKSEDIATQPNSDTNTPLSDTPIGGAAEKTGGTNESNKTTFPSGSLMYLQQQQRLSVWFSRNHLLSLHLTFLQFRASKVRATRSSTYKCSFAGEVSALLQS